MYKFIAILLSCIFTIPLFSSEKIVPNGDFSKGTKDWSLGKMSKIKNNVLIINDNSKTEGSSVHGAVIPLKPDQKKIYLSAEVKFEGAPTCLIYISLLKNGKRIKDQGLINSTSHANSWRQVKSDNYIVPDEFDAIRIWIHSSSKAVGKYYIDNIALHIAEKVNPKIFFKNAAKGHPRIYLTKSKTQHIKEFIKKDARAKKVYDKNIALAESYSGRKPIVYKKDGKRLLHPANCTRGRIKYLGFAYYMTGNKKYLDAGIKVLLRAIKVKSWNPSHFLDTATLAYAVGLGYDLFYDYLTVEQRKQVVDAIIEKAFKPSMEKHWWWLKRENNWNQICNGGLGIAALAIYEDKPELAGEIIKRSINNIPLAQKIYNPDGLYPEGLSYWDYGTRHALQFIQALEDVMGHSFGLADYKGFMKSPQVNNFLTGTSGKAFNFGDASPIRKASVATSWFAAKTDDPTLLFIENTLPLKPMFMYMIWASPVGTISQPKKLNWTGKGGDQEVATFRTSWDKSGTFLGLKGGTVDASHSHMDLGEFVIDACGVRWAADPERQRYGIAEKYMKDHHVKLQPWDIFRSGPFIHNIIMVDKQYQTTYRQMIWDGKIKGPSSVYVPVIKFSDSSSFAVLNLISAYEHQLKKFLRGGRLYGRSVLIQDEIESDKPVNLRWNMSTFAKVKSVDGNKVVLEATDENGKLQTMCITVLKPGDVKIKIIDPMTTEHAKKEFNEMPKGLSQITFNIELEANQKTTLAVFFRPGGEDDNSKVPEITGFEKW